ncbi:MAG: hypothetical protein LBU34_09860 [Planctomycetaceae bacterium]|jgi:hypothetical protein|nr:hypothetical protein [Planctomycetaceae bacterium]
MSIRTSHIPRKDTEFLAWAKTIFRNCEEHATEWQLNSKYLDQFSDLLSHAEVAYNNNIDEQLQNRATVTAKDGTFAALKQFLSMYVNALEGNPARGVMCISVQAFTR